MDYKFKESIAPVKKVVAIQFGVLSPEYIRNVSVTKMTYENGKKIPDGIFDQNNIYDPVTKRPVLGGVNDPRMGSTSDPENPGYFGHIELARPVYHYGFLNMTLNILRSVSYYTSKLLVSDKDLLQIKKTCKKKKRLKEILKMTKLKIDPVTKRLLPVYYKDGLKIVVEHNDPILKGSVVGRRTLSTLEAYSILEKISDEDVISMGLNPIYCRPEWLLLTVIPVPPPHVRPSVSMSSTQRCEDDLTHKLNDILKSNIALNTAIENGSQDHVIEQFENLLQYHVSTFFDNKIPGQKPSQQRSGKPLKTLRQRLVGKEGRVRGNLMGKRVDFSARTVITGDPNLDIDQVGVPLEIAMNLTIPEKVSEFNINKLQQLVNNGPNNHPGARYIIIPSKDTQGIKKIDLNYFKGLFQLKIGQTVERHLDNDDIVLFNRQPSLHKMSIMGHRVKVMSGKTFRINLSCTTPYNADFDGDEMNMHVPQNVTARAEAENIMMVHMQIVGPQSNKPVMGIVQDALLSTSKLTRRDMFIDRDMFMNTLMTVLSFNTNNKTITSDVSRISPKISFKYTNDLILTLNQNQYKEIPKPSIIINTSKFIENKNQNQNQNQKGEFYELWTGKQLFSMIVPNEINMFKSSNEAPDKSDTDMTETDTKVVISNGLLISGIVDKKTIGISEGSLVHILMNDYGPDVTKDFMNKIQKIANYFILNNGFTIGIGDTVADKETMIEVKTILNNVKNKVDRLNKSSKTKNPIKLENDINSELNKARDESGHKVHERLSYNNNFKATVSAGSKGNNLNISQILGCVGQQNIEGRRVSYGFKNRTLPHYDFNDMGQESRGFIENSYLTGLTPQEFFFHAMAGREGIIDTACKSVTGDTEILIIENGISKVVEIGSWINEKMLKDKENIQKTQELNSEFLYIKETVYIPTGTNDGITSWGLMTAVTRHDPGPLVYEVKTYSGRSVKVVESNSLLVYNEKTCTFDQKLTSQIKLGEYLPITASITEPPIINKYVDMATYFPKTEYIYGTDFNRAIKMMQDSMIDKDGSELFHIPRGWWSKHNNKSFTLPYPNKARLQRASIRSADIVDGCLYPYGASRDNGAELPDRFELNNENGIFIGLFLAEGHARIEAGSVEISNNDPIIRQFVKDWFSQRKIKWTEEIREIKQENGAIWTSSGVKGYSRLLGIFLHKFLGHMSQGKYVPNEAYTAPDEFIIGLLNGYYSGDGNIAKTGVYVGSVSEKLIQGITFLCSRLGIFGRITKIQQKKNNRNTINILPSYRLAINGQWAILFSQKIPMIESKKQKRLNELKQRNTENHRNFSVQNDMILDRIIEINKLDPINYPKVYDVTVPSTNNFSVIGKSCGLLCKNTSDTGYIARRLVKALEDLTVKYDGTVRDGYNNIVEFIYGEDGIDATFIETQEFSILSLNKKDFEKRYLVHSENEKNEKNDILKKEYEQLCIDQKMLRSITSFKEPNASKIADKYIPVPVNIKRILLNVKKSVIKNDDIKNNIKNDILTHQEIIIEVQNLLIEIKKSFYRHNKSCTVIISPCDENDGPLTLFNIHVRSNLASKILHNLQITQEQMIFIKELILERFNKSIVASGEMCGVVAAQSISGPCTQMCEVGTATIVVLRPDNSIYRGPISNLINPLCLNGIDGKLISEVVDIKNYRILSVNPKTEKTEWSEISQVSRLPANGSLVKVTTRSGKENTATLSHSFLKRTQNGIEPILGSELKIGDRIPVVKYTPTVPEPLQKFEEFELSKDFGWFIGAYLADGHTNGNSINISKIIPEFSNRVIEFAKIMGSVATYTFIKKEDKHKNSFGSEGKTKFSNKKLAEFLIKHFNKGSASKKIGSFVFQSNLEFIGGIISGYFDGDGNVNSIKGKQMIRSLSLSEQLTIDMITLLSYFGIFASKCKEKEIYHTIQISRKYAKIFKEKIGLTVIEKDKALDSIIAYVDRVDSKDSKDSKEYIDKIPELGSTLSLISKKLKIVENTYRRFKQKESIGRSTLIKYINKIENMTVPKGVSITEEINLLKIAANSDVIWDEIISLELIDDPKEYVYDFTVPKNQSFMVDCNILVHNTLNSVEYNTSLVIDWTNPNIRPPVRPNEKIGLFIDKLIEQNPTRCELQPDGHTIYLPLESGSAKAMSVDENGNIIWTELEAVTRHKPINKDGTSTLVKIKTESGREAIATKAKSFLVYDSVIGKIIDKEGSDLKIGDLVPIVNYCRRQEFRRTINLKTILDPREFVFTDYMIEAKKIILEANKTGPKTMWFHLIKDKVPYNRSDALRATIERASDEISGTKRSNIKSEKSKLMLIPNLVYPKSWETGPTVNGIPSEIELDREFGFLIGAYLAEGCVTDHQVCIANNNENYRKMATAWSSRHNISSRLNISNCGGPELNGGHNITSTTICIHSTTLRHLLVTICGRGSYEKRVPEFAFSGPDCFVEGLLDAYICGDGTVDNCGFSSAVSRSKLLRDGISLLLTRMGIYNRLSESMLVNKKDHKDPSGINKPIYYLNIKPRHAEKLSKFITAIDYKVERLNNYVVNKKNRKTVQLKNPDFFKDTLLDPIISIDEIISEHPYVYDITVEKTRNMFQCDGIGLKDTFHATGISSKNITMGVPRIKELINISKKLKSPSLTLYLNDGLNSNITEDVIKNKIEYKTFKDFIKSVQIFRDPNSTFIEDDRKFLEEYKKIPGSFIENLSEWVLRIEFDNDILAETNQTMFDLYDKINESLMDTNLTDNIIILMNDDNAERPVIRISTTLWASEKPIEDFEIIDILKKIELDILNKIHIQGLENITKVFINEKQVDLWSDEIGFSKHDIKYIETEGSNLRASFKIQELNHKKSMSNDIIEIYETLGIEAARQALINELRLVLSFDGSYVNYRHLALLCDVMTYRGVLTSMTRHGINRSDQSGTLMKCSFEETVDILTDAAAYSQRDTIKGVSENIMLGQLCSIGTGAFDVLMDSEMFDNVTHTDVVEPIAENIIENIICKSNMYIPSSPTYKHK